MLMLMSAPPFRYKYGATYRFMSSIRLSVKSLASYTYYLVVNDATWYIRMGIGDI